MNEVYLLPKFDVSSFSHDWRYIDFQTGHFANFKPFKTDSYFLPLGKSKWILLVHFYLVWAGQFFTNFGRVVRPQKTTQSLLDKKFKNFV